MSSDPCDTEAAWRPWNLCVTVEKPGRYGYRRSELKTPGLVVVWESFATRCRLRGLATPERLVVAVPLRVGPRTRYWGESVRPDRLPAMRSGGVDWVIDRGQSHVVLVVPRSLIRREYDLEPQVAFEHAASAHSVPVNPSLVEPLGARLLALIEEASNGPQQWSRSAIASLERKLLRQLLEVIDVPRLMSAKPDTSSRRAGIERALAHLQVASLPAVKLSELAEVAGVSARTLEHGFRDLFDLTPLGFLHLLRLYAVRRELSAGDGAGRTVREVAEHWGFRQAGRFSGYYRKAFGELPSETRQRVAKPAKGQGAVSAADSQETRVKTSRARPAS